MSPAGESLFAVDAPGDKTLLIEYFLGVSSWFFNSYSLKLKLEDLLVLKV